MGLFYIGMAVLRTDSRRADGQTGRRAYGQVITKIYEMGRLANFLRNGATLARASRT